MPFFSNVLTRDLQAILLSHQTLPIENCSTPAARSASISESAHFP